MKGLHIVSVLLVVVGALNWGLVGLLNFDFVKTLLGSVVGADRLVYILVGAAGIYLLATHRNDCKVCSKK